VLLEEGSLDTVWASNVLEHARDLPALMGNCLRLLKVGGEMRIEVPYEKAPRPGRTPPTCGP
jgi:predicted SAM-dependent methyltransferase